MTFFRRLCCCSQPIELSVEPQPQDNSSLDSVSINAVNNVEILPETHSNLEPVRRPWIRARCLRRLFRMHISSDELMRSPLSGLLSSNEPDFSELSVDDYFILRSRIENTIENTRSPSKRAKLTNLFNKMLQHERQLQEVQRGAYHNGAVQNQRCDNQNGDPNLPPPDVPPDNNLPPLENPADAAEPADGINDPIGHLHNPNPQPVPDAALDVEQGNAQEGEALTSDEDVSESEAADPSDDENADGENDVSDLGAASGVTEENSDGVLTEPTTPSDDNDSQPSTSTAVHTPVILPVPGEVPATQLSVILQKIKELEVKNQKGEVSRQALMQQVTALRAQLDDEIKQIQQGCDNPNAAVRRAAETRRLAQEAEVGGRAGVVGMKLRLNKLQVLAAMAIPDEMLCFEGQYLCLADLILMAPPQAQYFANLMRNAQNTESDPAVRAKLTAFAGQWLTSLERQQFSIAVNPELRAIFTILHAIKEGCPYIPVTRKYYAHRDSVRGVRSVAPATFDPNNSKQKMAFTLWYNPTSLALPQALAYGIELVYSYFDPTLNEPQRGLIKNKLATLSVHHCLNDIQDSNPQARFILRMQAYILSMATQSATTS